MTNDKSTDVPEQPEDLEVDGEEAEDVKGGVMRFGHHKEDYKHEIQPSIRFF